MKKNSGSVESEIQKLDREIAESGRIVGFRFDDATAAELSTILGEETFQTVREGLERTARFLMTPPVESRRDRLQRRRAVSHIPGLVARLIDTVTVGRIQRAVAIGVKPPDVSRTLDGLRELSAFATEIAKFRAGFRVSLAAMMAESVALHVAAELERVGVRLGTAERSRFGRVLNLVLHAGDPGRTGSDVRHLQKYALAARKRIGGSFQFIFELNELTF